MKKFSLTLLAFFLVLNISIFAQQRNCASMAHLEYQQIIDPDVNQRMESIERFTQEYVQHPNNQRAVITIPVVFHVVYRTSTENISDAQIQSQLDVLNDDFRRLNSDANNTWSQAVDTEIQFCLATVDPNGNATNGITRTSTTVNGFGTNDAMKFTSQGGKDAWDASKYMNFWVCNIGGGILGYAQFPGGAAATDGIVCDGRYTGTVGTATAPFDLGRTATHEVGHYLNLRHIWGDGNCNQDDFVSDTPTSDAANYGCATGHVSCSSTDMVQNYMDYSDDACMNLYTQGQKDRMQALFASGGARFSLGNSTACGAAPEPTCTDGQQNGEETGVDCGGSSCPACPTNPTCDDGQQNGEETGVDCGGSSCPACPCNGSTITITINTDNYGSETTWALTDASGAAVASGGPYNNNTTYSGDVCVPDGCYDFTINDSYGDGICCAYGTGSYSITSGGSTLASGGEFTSTETKNFCVGGGDPTPTCTDGTQNGDETGVDCGGASCPACPTNPTCDDGTQNGDETGVDCGGSSCPACPPTGGCDDVNFNNFDSGWGIWNDGGSDVRRSVNDGNYANSGSYCVRLRDNSGSASSMTTDNLALDGYSEVTIEFSYYIRSFEGTEDFWVDASVDGGSSWTAIKAWTKGTDFNNNERHDGAVTIVGTFTNSTKLRIRCDASGNSDWVYVDDVDVSACSTARTSGDVVQLPTTESEVYLSEQFRNTDETLSISNMNLFPNPTSGNLTVAFDVEESTELQFMIVDLTGKVVSQEVMNVNSGRQQIKVDGNNFAPGYYFVHLINGKDKISDKFVIVR